MHEVAMTAPTGRGVRVLVTGGAGFIGVNLVRFLLERGQKVTVLDDLSVGRRQALPPGVRLIKGDICDEEVVNEAISETDVVVHLAAQTGVPLSLEYPRRDLKTNVVGTFNLLDACRSRAEKGAPIRRFVFASSNAPLGRQVPPATEDKAPLPISPYGASKLAGEGYCLAFHGSWGLPTVVLRFGNVYGPHSAHKQSVVAKFMSDILHGGNVTIDGDGTQTRDFIFVDDLCRAILAAFDRDVAGEVFQIATGRETSITELVEVIRSVTNHNLAVQRGAPRLGDTRASFSAIDKATTMLGWRPETLLEQGLQKTWAWFANAGTLGPLADQRSQAC